MKTYNFEVPAFYHYEIEASSEEEARAILEEKGGIDIDGTLCELDYRDYQNAKLIEEASDEY